MKQKTGLDIIQLFQKMITTRLMFVNTGTGTNQAHISTICSWFCFFDNLRFCLTVLLTTIFRASVIEIYSNNSSLSVYFSGSLILIQIHHGIILLFQLIYSQLQQSHNKKKTIDCSGPVQKSLSQTGIFWYMY